MEATKFTVDEVIGKFVGQFGFWQIRTLLVVSMVKVPTAWQMASVLFSGISDNDFWCERPEGFKLMDVEKWRKISHPKEIDKVTGRSFYNPCNIYDLNYTEILHKDFEFDLDRYMLKNLSLRRCENFEYSTPISLARKWDLVCHRKFFISLSQFFYLFGLLVGYMIAPMMTARYSPRRVVLSGMIFQIVTGVMTAYSPLVELKVLMRFFVACSCAHMFSAGYDICTDWVQGNAKVVFACCYEMFWSLGIVTLAIWAYFLPNWLELQLALSIPTFVLLLFFSWIPNSPRWLIVNHRYSDAREELIKGCRMNGMEVPDLNIESCLTMRYDEEGSWLEYMKESNKILLTTMHVTVSGVLLYYYGSILNVKNLGGNIIINTIIAGYAGITGIIIGIGVILRFNRKWMILGLVLLVGGIGAVGSWAVPQDNSRGKGTELYVVMLATNGILASALGLVTVHQCTGQVFDPRFRKTSWTSCCIMGRVVILLAPVIESTAEHGNRIPLSIYGGVSIIAGVASLITELQIGVLTHQAAEKARQISEEEQKEYSGSEANLSSQQSRIEFKQGEEL